MNDMRKLIQLLILVVCLGCNTTKSIDEHTILITGGTGKGQIRFLKVEPDWTIHPDETSEFKVLPYREMRLQ